MQWTLANNWQSMSIKMRPSLNYALLKPNNEYSKDEIKNKYHIWNGLDALCQKYTKHPDHCGGFEVVNMHPDDIEMLITDEYICKNCQDHSKNEYNKYMQNRYGEI